jgi:hypothetical protein
MTKIRQFNTVFIEFVRDIHKVFPDDPEIKSVLTSSSLMIKMRPYLIANMFADNLGRYEHYIYNKDVHFLFTHDFQDPTLAALINKLKIYWSVLDDDNKEILWIYMNTMMVLVK